MMIYKILRADEWEALRDRGEIPGPPVDVRDGFVHFSTGTQLRETARRHFAGESGLELLACDSDAMGADLRWEPSRRGDLFPHLYRALRRTDVVWHRPLPADGSDLEPDLPA
ncbi:DUF952 domain-containing protein [uncultured Paracoccus sp.]|uniref:DUF952 domain-containing protein n=1 Tax=uncultured Paracoccus sp. TaxID=189685 RepID=UPI00262350F1|nr:DUF952 domain-containing protein [uncultured Paracoccus sp.]